MPRSGSSMVAGIFAKHGVWSGTPYHPQHWGGRSAFENRVVKQHMIARWGRLEMGPEVDQDGGQEILDLIRKDGYEGGKWMFKVSAMYWRAFTELNPTIVCIRRPEDSIRKSVQRDNIKVDVTGHIQIMDRLESQGALRIEPDPLVQKQYDQAREVFAACGLTFQPEIAEAFIEPSMWHHRAG